MSLLKITVCLLFTGLCFGQTLPDRDELVNQFKDPATIEPAVRELYKHFGMGGIRSVMSNINKLPLEQRLQWMHTFHAMDFNRFFNDIAINLDTASDPETKAMWLKLLAVEGRTIDPKAFEKYVNDESQDLRVRLAAMSGLVQRQDPERYKQFYALADKAVVDPVTGRNDLAYALLTKQNQALFFFTRSMLEKGKASHGSILIALSMADAGDSEVFSRIIELKDKKYTSFMVDRAVAVGGVAILDMMANHKLMKKDLAEINAAKPAAAALAGHLSKLYHNQTHDRSKTPLAAVLPTTVKGSGSMGKHAGFAIVHVDAAGNVNVIEKQSPMGGSVDFSGLPAKTVPAYLEWESIESYYLLSTP